MKVLDVGGQDGRRWAGGGRGGCAALGGRLGDGVGDDEGGGVAAEAVRVGAGGGAVESGAGWGGEGGRKATPRKQRRRTNEAPASSLGGE